MKPENLLLLAGSPDRVRLIGFRNDALKPLTGKRLSEVAKMRGKSPEETAMDLIIEDDSRVETVYFLMSEENIRKQMRHEREEAVRYAASGLAATIWR